VVVVIKRNSPQTAEFAVALIVSEERRIALIGAAAAKGLAETEVEEVVVVRNKPATAERVSGS